MWVKGGPGVFTSIAFWKMKTFDRMLEQFSLRFNVWQVNIDLNSCWDKPFPQQTMRPMHWRRYAPLDQGEMMISSYPAGRNGRHFAGNVFKCIFMDEKFCILNRLSRKLVPNDLIDNIPELFQIMAWRWSDDKPLSEPMLTQFTDAYMRH